MLTRGRQPDSSLNESLDQGFGSSVVVTVKDGGHADNLLRQRRSEARPTNHFLLKRTKSKMGMSNLTTPHQRAPRYAILFMALSWISFLTLAATPTFAQEATPKAAETVKAETTPVGATPAADKEAPTADAAEEGWEDREASVDQLYYAIDNIVMFFCAVLVLFMQGGFAMVEAGFNAAKNTVNILFKNVMDLCIGVLLFFALGFGLMYPSSWAVGFGSEEEGAKAYGVLGTPSFGVGQDSPYPKKASDPAPEAGSGTLHDQVNWLFQVAFAATAATIVSGAVAGRMKFSAYLVYSALLTGIIYPLSGAWHWGGGFLADLGFWDFAGSLIVHAVGGFAGLAGAIALGPRKGRFTEDGKSVALPGHNLTIASLGVVILLIGWYGFNPGSQLQYAGFKNTDATVLIAANTTLAAAAGGFLAMVTSWFMFKKPDLSMALNGVLAGLVGITANCDCVTNNEAIIIGAIAGVLVVFGVILLDKLRIDDPVGAWPVHGLCGIWGGIATGLFGEGKDLIVQLIGTFVYCAWAFLTMYIIFMILKSIGMLRVSPDEESKGLDLSEHGMEAYHHG